MQGTGAIRSLWARPVHTLAVHLRVTQKAGQSGFRLVVSRTGTGLQARILIGVGLDQAAGTSQVGPRSLLIHLGLRSLPGVIHLGLIVHLYVRCLTQ